MYIHAKDKAPIYRKYGKVPEGTNGSDSSRAKFSTSDGFGRKSTTASNSSCTPLFLRAEPKSIGVNARRLQLRRMAAWKSDKNAQSHNDQ